MKGLLRISTQKIIMYTFAEGYGSIDHRGNVYRDHCISHEGDRRHQAFAIDETKSIVFEALNTPFIWN